MADNTSSVIEHNPEVNESYPKGYFDVFCSCGFTVTSIGTEEAANDTVNWHLGLPSSLGGELS